MNKVKPSMIVIDSLSSCSGAKAGDENKAEFAQPLYWLSAKNGIPLARLQHRGAASRREGHRRRSRVNSHRCGRVRGVEHHSPKEGFRAGDGSACDHYRQEPSEPQW